MAVTEGAWWSAHWGWMVWWLLGAAGLLTLAGLATWRLVGRSAPEGDWAVDRYSPLYLDNEAVIDQYKLGSQRAALRQEVEERRSRTFGWLAWLPFLSGSGAHGKSGQDMFVKYVEEKEPISVIGMLMSAFKRADALVEVDMGEGTLVPNRRLISRFAGRIQAGEAVDVALTDLGAFVMIEGQFKAEDGDGETLVMRAPYGGGPPRAHVLVVLRRDGLRRPDKQLPKGVFRAHCLGKVTSWDPDTRETIVERPLAVFQ
ncbi:MULTISPECIES: hypothetical protein [unclassified Streptomyces]|uniref:hypothetical protein n=1 Tax=unclassified Streptomyces TaxID=2593676 RepID=UPI001F04109B|nr:MULTISPECIES: hypothetical protein [unclassified Streptomyces]MCH0565966.1 hypothetical protein [Streptomyces sp. MUM 2J]MCH0569131.1 hypothetical protein [Streptomyces sp. MUM 136J]